MNRNDVQNDVAQAVEKGEGQGRHVKFRGRLPDKRTINLAVVNVKHINWKLAIPLILLILCASAAFCKFAVLDRMEAAEAAKAEVLELQRQLDMGYAAIENYGDINEIYAHYTYSGMTEEERTRADRIEMMRLIERVVLPTAPVNDWYVHENQLELNINGHTLQEINQIVQLLLAEDIVDYCTVSTASTNDPRKIQLAPDEIVTAKLIIYLRNTQQEVQP